MAPTLSLAFFAYCLLFYAGLGLWLSALFETRTTLQYFSCALASGIALAAILATLGYFAGLSTAALFPILTAAAAAGWIVCAYRAFRQRLVTWPPSSHVTASLLVLVAITVCLLLPGWIGGLQFTISQSNHYDTFNYLESAMSYMRLSYRFLQQDDMSALIQAGGFPFAHDNLLYRPPVAILFATLAHFAPSAFLGLHHVFILSLISVNLVVLSALFETLSNGRPAWFSLVLTGSVFLGFWGQYIVDIDAWSQAGWMPLASLAASYPFFVAECPSAASDPKSPGRFVGLWLLLFIGGIYYYPEGAAFFLVPLGVIFLRAISYLGMRRTIGSLLLLGPLAALLLIPVYRSNVLYIFGQYRQAMASVDFWTYFVTYIGGYDGLGGGWFKSIADGTAAILGAYFVTPTPSFSPVAATALRLATLGFLLLFLTAGYLGWQARFKERAQRFTLPAFLALLIGETLYLWWRGQYWTTGKALSFIMPITLVTCLALCLQSAGAKRRPWGTAGAVCAVLLAVAGWFFAAERISIARDPRGMQHALPYPPNSPNDLFKTTFDFNDLSFLQTLTPRDQVIVDIESDWPESFVRLELLAHGIPFHLKGPMRISRYTELRLPPVTGQTPPTAVLTVTLDGSRNGMAHIKVTRP